MQHAWCDYAKETVEVKLYRSANSCWSVLLMTTVPPPIEATPPICTFSNAADSLGAHVPGPSTPHSSNLDWFCLLNLLLSYSLTILRPPFKASSILICHPSSLLWCGTLGDDIHVNGPVDKGLFTLAGLIPSPYFFTDMQVERGGERRTRVLAFSPRNHFCRWLVGIVSPDGQ